MLDTWRPLCVWCVMASMPLHPSADRTRFNFECHVSSVTSYTCRHVMSSFVQPCNQKNDIWSFRPKSRPTINIDWPESWILSAQSFYKDSCGFSVCCFTVWWMRCYKLCVCPAGKLWSRSVKVAYNLLHKLGTKQEPLVRPGDRVS